MLFMRNFILFFAFLAACPAEVGDDALVAHWTFDEGSGSTVADSSGRGNTGTMRGDATFAPGILGSALECGNGGAWVDILPSDQVPGRPLEFNKDYTLMAWILPERVDGWRTIISKVKDSEDKQYWINGGQLNGGWETGSGEGAIGGGVLVADVWQHVAYSCSADKLLRLYINGVLVAEKQESHSLAKIDDEQIVRIGRMAYNRSFDFRGRIDDARIYNRALEPTEVLELVEDHVLLPPDFTGLATADPTTAAVGETIRFTVPPATDPNAGDILTYRWDFGDGASAEGRTVEHQYDDEGSYTARVTVSDQVGLQAVSNPVLIGIGQAAPTKLIGHWPFDGDADDHSGRDHHGAISGSVEWVAGHDGSGQGIRLGGSSHVVVPNHADFDAATRDFTIMAWIRPDADPGTNPGIFNKAYVKDHTQFTLEIATKDNFGRTLPEKAICSATADNDDWMRLYGGAVQTETWQHVAVSCRPFNADKSRYRLYIDGEVVAEAVFVNNPSINQPIWIGRGGSWWAQKKYFKGVIDELRMYAYGMSDLEIAAFVGAPVPVDRRTIDVAVQMGGVDVPSTCEALQDGIVIYGPTTADSHQVTGGVPGRDTELLLDGPVPLVDD